MDAVRALGLMDTPPEERFDRIARLAAALFDMPVVLITLIDDHREWFKARIGTDISEMPRDLAFCSHTLVDATDGIMQVPDALADDRFRDNPVVQGDPLVRFYVARVLCTREGLPVGTLCLFDLEPRQLSDAQVAALHDLGALVEDEIARDEQLHRLNESERIRSSIHESLTEGVILHGPDGAIVDWNRAAEELLGVPGRDLAGRTPDDERWHTLREDGSAWPGASHPAMVALRSGVASGGVVGVERPDGTQVWLQVNAQPISDLDGRSQVFVVFSDLTERRRLEGLARRMEKSARSSLDALAHGVILVESDGTIAQINPAAERLLGYAAAELNDLSIARDWEIYDDNWDLIPRERRPVHRAYYNDEDIDGEVVGWVRKDGRRLRLRVTVARNTAGEGTLLLGFSDVTAEEKLLRHLAQYHVLFQHADDMITVLEQDLTVRYSSPATERMLGYPFGWRHPDGLLGLIHPGDRAAAVDALDELVNRRRGPEPIAMRVKAHSGEWRTVETIGVNLLAEPGVLGLVLTSRDITDRQRLTDQLAYLAQHDHLTGLANRSVLESSLAQALADVDISRGVGVCCLDLDGFKAVNDQFGHAVGDDLLVEVADRICGIVRAGDTAIRLGGDEFAIVLDAVATLDDAIDAARRIRDTLVTPPLRRSSSTVGVSVGVAFARPGDAPVHLMRRADDAVYRAKARGGSAVEGEHLDR